MGIREQIIYCTPNGNLQSYLTFSLFSMKSVSSWKIHEQNGTRQSEASRDDGAISDSSFFISFCEETTM
jgi:hypothetical protein